MANDDYIYSDTFVTPEGRFLSMFLWTASQYKGKGDFKYNTHLVFDKSDDLSAITDVYNQVLQEKFGGTLPAGHNDSGLLDGDTHKSFKDDPNYAGKWVLKCSKKQDHGKVDILDLNNNPIINKSDFYSGCYGHAAIQFMGYDDGAGGISCKIEGVLKSRDGESVVKRPNAKSIFANSGVVKNAGVAQPSPSQPAATTPPAPPAPPAPPTMQAAHVMTPAANGQPYEAYIEAGWTDEQLISNGLMAA